MARKQLQKSQKTSKEAEKTCCRRTKSIKTRIETTGGPADQKYIFFVKKEKLREFFISFRLFRMLSQISLD